MRLTMGIEEPRIEPMRIAEVADFRFKINDFRPALVFDSYAELSYNVN